MTQTRLDQLTDAQSDLAVAILQMLPTDDQIIADRVRRANQTLIELRASLRNDTLVDDSQDTQCTCVEVHDGRCALAGDRCAVAAGYPCKS